jgi:hypothetical protein
VAKRASLRAATTEDVLGSLVVIRPRHRTSRDTGALPGSNNGSRAGNGSRPFLPEETRFPAADLARAAQESGLIAGQIFFVSGKNPRLTRESTDTTLVMAIFGGTTEIIKEIISCLGL